MSERECVRICVYVRAVVSVCASVCVCVRERERVIFLANPFVIRAVGVHKKREE